MGREKQRGDFTCFLETIRIRERGPASAPLAPLRCVLQCPVPNGGYYMPASAGLSDDERVFITIKRTQANPSTRSIGKRTDRNLLFYLLS